MNDRSGESYGERGATPVDRFGVWLSGRAIRRHLPARNDLRVLELGCGYRAAQLVAIRDRLASGVGVDFRIAPELLKEPAFSFIEASIEQALPRFELKSFDAILLISVLEHLVDPLGVVTRARELLRPGGILLINVPTWRGKFFLELSAFRLGLSPKVEMDDHKMYYDQRDLWPLLVKAGFRPSNLHLAYHKFGLNLFAAAATPLDG
jgi:SAM-dependent methyltransferase